MAQKILILGATSAIARATAAAYAKRGDTLFLAARDMSELKRIASDLFVRFGNEVKYGYFDAKQTDLHGAFLQHVISELESLDGMLLAFGYLADPQINADFSEYDQVITSNFTGAVSILNICAEYFAKHKRGFMIGIGSVAGDRSRQENHIYGVAKGALALYLQGLRARLCKQGVRVITVKPGFVDSPMTFGRQGLFLVAKPEKIGEQIVATLNKKRDVVYLPWFWYFIMLLVKLIPERIFKHMRF